MRVLLVQPSVGAVLGRAWQTGDGCGSEGPRRGWVVRCALSWWVSWGVLMAGFDCSVLAQGNVRCDIATL